VLPAPIAFYGYGELGVRRAQTRSRFVIMSWPWGTYSATTDLRDGIAQGLVVAAHRPNVIPHVAKATGVYLNSMLAVTEAINAGYDEAIMLTHDGYLADGSGESLFVVHDGVLYTPDLATGILRGITRNTVIQIAQDLGYTVIEKNLIRSDLHVADEVFMCGTAAEVTPIREVDDVELGVGEVTLAIQKAYLDTATGVSERLGALARAGRELRARRSVTQATRTVHLSRPGSTSATRSSCSRRCAPGWLSLGPTGRASRSCSPSGRRAVLRGRLERDGGLHLCMRLAGVGPGDEVITSPYSFVASANCAIYEGATPVFADIDPRTFNLDPAAVEAAITERTKAIVAVDIFGYPCELDALLALCERHGLALVEDACEALGARYKGRPLGSHGHPRRSRSTRTSR
jgi:hypothetical protein